MSIFIKEMIKKKLKQISPDELLHHGKQYGFSISNAQANQISNFLKQNSLDPFRTKDREKMFYQLAEITDLNTSKQAKKLLDEIIKSYGLEHLFE